MYLTYAPQVIFSTIQCTHHPAPVPLPLTVVQVVQTVAMAMVTVLLFLQEVVLAIVHATQVGVVKTVQFVNVIVISINNVTMEYVDSVTLVGQIILFVMWYNLLVQVTHTTVMVILI